MLQLFGGLIKFIFSPIINIIMSLLYGILIRGPLTALNYLDIAFQKLSGTNVDKLLFSTSVVDGETHFNFFTSDSPLKIFFLTILGISGTLLTIFLGISVMRTVSGKKAREVTRKVGNVALSSALVFSVPTLFLMALSLTGGVLSAINGGYIEISSNNIEIYQTDTFSRVNNLKSASQAYQKFDDQQKLANMEDQNGEIIDLSLSEIYSNLSNETTNWVDSDEQIMLAAMQSKNDFYEVKKALVEYDYDNSQFILKNSLNNQLVEINNIITQLKPKQKNESSAEKIKIAQNEIQSVIDLLNKWATSSKELIEFQVNSESPRNRALNNFRLAFNTIYGNKTDSELFESTTISNLQELNQEFNFLINGSYVAPSYGLLSLRQNLTSIQDNSLVVTFYQVATGRHDSNWDRAFVPIGNDGIMLLIGFFLIIGACGIMFMAALFAVTRIFDLALLFIISPGVVTLSALDDGARMKSWINMVIAKLISIYGIVISLRLFGILNNIFREMINYSGSTGADYTLNLFLLSIFGLGGMFAAYRSSQILSGIVGAGYGIMEGLQMGQITQMLKGGARKTINATKKVLGIPNANKKAMMQSRYGKSTNEWKRRYQSVNNGLSKATSGSSGNKEAKANYFDKKSEYLTEKQTINEKAKNAKDKGIEAKAFKKERKNKK